MAFLTGRDRAYGYRHTERFLAELAQVGADEAFTKALALWTTALWKPQAHVLDNPVPVFYIDGHRKAVYADHLIPRGLVGRQGKVLGCRALVVLHDQADHPRLVTTHRGDQHLTSGRPAIITRYEQAADLQRLERVVVDREGMEALVSRHIGKPRAHRGDRAANGSVQWIGVVSRGGRVCSLAG